MILVLTIDPIVTNFILSVTASLFAAAIYDKFKTI